MVAVYDKDWAWREAWREAISHPKQIKTIAD